MPKKCAYKLNAPKSIITPQFTSTKKPTSFKRRALVLRLKMTKSKAAIDAHR